MTLARMVFRSDGGVLHPLEQLRSQSRLLGGRPDMAICSPDDKQ